MTEMAQYDPEARRAALQRANSLHKPADDLLRAIYAGKTAWAARPTAQQEKMRAAYATVKEDPGASVAWMRLLNHLGHNSPLLSIEPVIVHLGPQPGNTLLDALLMLALRHCEWRQEPETWLPESTDLPEQFHSLLRHLFALYPVPRFLDAAWFAGFTLEGEQQRDWFLHIGAGQNIRRAELPLRFTEKAAHHFLLAPNTLSIVGALRWGQVMGLGGDEALAQAIADSKMGRILPEEPFWFTVLHFFVNNPQRSAGSVGPLVDYLYHQKFGEQDGPDGKPDPDAPEPDMTMKGRTLRATQKRMEMWHEALAKEAKRPRSAWDPSGIEEFHAAERDPYGTWNEWSILELLNSHALREEGREMKHCVFTYAGGCLNGTTSIFSLRVKTGETRTRRLLTIEVNLPRRAIVQVRGRCNMTLGSYAGKARMKVAGTILRRWAKEQKLSVACGL